MNLLRTVAISILVLGSLASTPRDQLNLSAEGNAAQTYRELQQEFNPPHVFPAKSLYEVEEGETIMISLNVIFPSSNGGCIETVGYDVLQPAPDFVTVAQTFRREFNKPGNNEPYTHQMALLILSPQVGDAGKFEINIGERLCPQSAVSVLSFKVNVRRASMNQHLRRRKTGIS